MDMGMGTSIYLLLGGDEDETKVWYPLCLGMRMRTSLVFFDENSSLPRPVVIPLSLTFQSFLSMIIKPSIYIYIYIYIY